MKSVRWLLIFYLLTAISERVFGQSGSSAPRAHAYRVKSCCNDYPSCEGENEFAGKTNRLEIDASVWNVDKDGKEEVYIFYHNIFMKFRFETAGNTPILDTTREDQNISLQFAGLSHVNAAYSAGKVFYLIDNSKIQVFDSALSPQTLTMEEIKKRNPWLNGRPGMKMFAPIRIAGKGSNGSLLVHWKPDSKSKTEASKAGSSGNVMEYEYELYDIETLAVPFKGKIKGFLASGYGRGTEPITKNSRGMYFTSDGRACLFSKDNYGTDFKMETLEGTDVTKQPPCWMASIFLGCPQSFCYQGDVDDIFYWKRHTNAPDYVLFREAYFYQVKVNTGKPLPMKAPRVSEVKFVQSVNDIEQLMENIDSAFNMKENNTWITVMVKNDIVKYYENDRLANTDSDKPWVVFDGFGQSLRIDATVYDNVKKLLYIFFGNHYSTFTRDMPRGLNAWKVVKANQSFEDFKGVPPYLDGSFDHYSQKKIFLLKGSYYYEMDAGDNPDNILFSVKPSLTDSSSEEGIFHLEGCPEQTKKLNLKSRYRTFQPAKYVSPIINDSSEKRTWNPIWITLVATAAFVLFSLLLGAFLLLNKRRRRKKKPSKQGKKGKKGKKVASNVSAVSSSRSSRV